MFYGGFVGYSDSYTKVWAGDVSYLHAGYAKVWAKAYGVTSVGSPSAANYTKLWSRNYAKAYDQNVSYQGDVVVSYLGTALTSGVAGSGGAGFDFGSAGTTGSPDNHLHVVPQEGQLLNGGEIGRPDLSYGHTRINGGKGGNLGNMGTGGGEHFQRKTRFGRSGDGGLPGAAISGYNASRVSFIYTGNILGDPQFKYAT